MGVLLPLFPLDNVLFPDMVMPLHIFEQRYRLLVRRSLRHRSPFGIVLIPEGQEVGGGALPYRVGTLAQIVAHAALPDGRSLITVRGERRFEIDAGIDDAEPARPLADTVAEAYADYVVGVVAATGGARRELPIVEELRTGSPCDVSFRVAAGLAIEDDERQALLEVATAGERLRREREILSRECALLSEMLVRMRARGEGPTLH